MSADAPVKPFLEHPIDANLVEISTKHGAMVVNKNGKYLEESLIKYGEFMENERQIFKVFVKDGDWALDIGANIGLHTRNLSNLVGAAGRIYAFEPQPYLQRILAANIARNQHANTVQYFAGLGAARGTMFAPYYDPSLNLNFGGINLNQQGGAEVSVLKLDEIAFESRVSLVKIDVEGMEQEVLLGGTEFFRSHRPVVYCENDRVHKYQALLEQFWQLNYRVWWHLPYYLTHKNPYRNADLLTEQEPYLGLRAINVLAIPKEFGKIEIPLPEATAESPTYPEVQAIYDAMLARGAHG